ncbi:hypothetical protein [Niameybacter sp.]|uniref:hypothetical protein n=1 Tax=Niameybacter sp. TaxID=2033640 RepID=UPI002FC99928
MNKKIGIILLSIGIMALSGCISTQPVQSPQDTDKQIIVLQEEKQQLEAEIDKLNKQVNQLIEENKNLKAEMQKLSEEDYILYTRDVDSWEIIELGNVVIEKDMSLQEKIQQIADEISRLAFEGLKIQVEEIKTIGNKKIALINLKDIGETSEWMNQYFQGSTGAGITMTILEESLLQRNSPYSWIDGIEIVYNGEILSSSHIELGNILYR